MKWAYADLTFTFLKNKNEQFQPVQKMPIALYSGLLVKKFS